MICLEEVVTIAASKSIALLVSHDKFRELFKSASLETQQGVSMGLDMVVTVGRNPTKWLCLMPMSLYSRSLPLIYMRVMVNSRWKRPTYRGR